MQTRQNSTVTKSVIAVLVAVFILTLMAGNAFAATRSGTLGGATDEVDPGIEPPPDPGIVPEYMVVSSIEFKTNEKGVYAFVRVVDQSGKPVPGALVRAEWGFPDGTTMKVEGSTAGDGMTYFAFEKTSGEHKLQIVDVKLNNLPFNAANSQLFGSIVIKG